MSSLRHASTALLSTIFLVVPGCLDRPPGTPEAVNEPPSTPAGRDAGVAAPVAAPTEAPERSREHVAKEPVANERLGDVTKTPEDSLIEAPLEQPADGKDPLRGKFTLADATATLPGTGALVATIKTNKGEIRCTLLEDKAPNTVANFVGLARGVRPYKSHIDGRWVKQPLYDGTSFHRVIKGFMIQGGDPVGNGSGEPGYVIPDEIWPGARHDHAGQLCMANRGKNTNGAQFFITDASVPHLDGNYTIFGECTPTSVVRAIATAPKGPDDRPTARVTIEKVEISRDATKGGAKPPSAGRP
ncbi:MAG TPA: peptidylprolyl isomerase [Labilithrix sp.]|nr:peptidylprolyl isomerase [Labilithrix sp.]